ncbi:MAG TPA: 5-formyltetrahydrofolate cyclo-ligase [Ilumatobacteraceae bacterium]|nr:5-formyltetrahydrofolate cyclo-ligase [Ilumatobacteraceae bacterium]
MTDGTAPTGAKVEIRRRMRQWRRELTDRDVRSERLWHHAVELPAVAAAGRVLVFATVVGEPEIGPFERWCAEHGVAMAVPEDDVDPAWPDVVVVPGLAFTADGRRLGQGGGWYDRYLAQVPPGCVTVGVCFAGQLVDDLPTEPHDIAVDVVVTEQGLARQP